MHALRVELLVQYVMRRIVDFAPTERKPFVLGLPTGSSPIKTYAKLAQFVKEGKLSFKYVVTFNMDEYCGLPEDHPESYHSFMHKHLFSKVDADPKNINILNGNAPDLKAECARYEAKIASLRTNSTLVIDHGGFYWQMIQGRGPKIRTVDQATLDGTCHEPKPRNVTAEQCAATLRQWSTPDPAPADPRYRAWQTGHQVVVRASMTRVRSSSPQRRHGSPPRP